MQDADVIVIGSGPAGAHAALAAIESGATVLMVDGGRRPQPLPDPETDFVGLRTERPDQWKWLLGQDLSGIPVDGLTGGLGGGQVSGNRSYVVQDADRELPLALENAQVVQSLALGGLGASWGATSAYLTSDELKLIGLPANEMETAYDEVTGIVGISGSGERKGVQPPLDLDHHAESVLQMYNRRKSWFDRTGLAVIRPHAAILTKDLGNRKANTYGDTDYAADQGRSVYRPQYTIDELLQHPRFSLVCGTVLTCMETADGVTVSVRTTAGEQQVRGKKLILCAGTVGTARILLRSLRLTGQKIPFLGKHHVFSACIDWKTFGNAGPRKRTSLCQLVMLDTQKRNGLDAGIAQLYSYRALQLFRLLGSVPSSTPEALRVLSVLSPALVIADIRFPAFRNNSDLMLLPDGKIGISCAVSTEERALRMQSWKRLRLGLRAVGLLPVKNMWLPEASSSHYAGTVPVDTDPSLPLSCDENGRVRQCSRVWVADPSMFRCFPAKPHTLTIMANARRIAQNVVKATV